MQPIFQIDNSRLECTILQVRGEVDIGRSDAFREAIGRAGDCCSKRLVIALGECTYFDCSGVRALVRMRQELGSRLKIVIPKAHLTYRVFEILGLLGPLEIVSTLDEALRLPVGAA